MDRKYLSLSGLKAITAGNGGLEGYLAVFGNVDDGGDRILPGAFLDTLDEFKRSGFQALNHNWDGLPIGYVDDAHEDDHGLFVRFLYHSHQAAQDARSVAVERMAAGKTVGQSIGYEIPAGGAFRDEQGVRNLRKLILFEGSQVSAPMNREALATAVKGGGRVDMKKAIGAHSTDTTDAGWDGPKQIANLNNEDGAAEYRQMYAWVDPDADADTKAAYKLPHHMVSDGKVGAANVKGCIAGIAVLNGSRGGADIPDGDRQGVYRHLAKHIRDAGEDPPELKARPAAGRKWMGGLDYGYPMAPAAMFFGGEPLEGTYEDLIEDLGDALNAPMTGMPWSGTYSYVCVLATYPDHCVAVTWGSEDDPDEPVYWSIPYTLDVDGDPVPGTPEQVTISFTPANPDAGVAFMGHAGRMLAGARAFAKRAAARTERRFKEGRELSGANRETLKAIADSLLDCHKQLMDIHQRTDPAARDEAKAADVAALWLDFQRVIARDRGVAV